MGEPHMPGNRIAAVFALATTSLFESKNWLQLTLLVLLFVLIGGSIGFGLWIRSWRRSLGQIERGLEQYSKANYAPVIRGSAAALDLLVQKFNALGSNLRAQQRSAEQSEQLLHTLIDAAPMAILLLEGTGEIEYANETARDLFFEGRDLARANFISLLSEAQAPLREAVMDVHDRLFTVDVEGVSETYHLAKRHFEL